MGAELYLSFAGVRVGAVRGKKRASANEAMGDGDGKRR